MTRLIIALVAAGIMLMLAACSAGVDFKRPDVATLKLGKTNEEEIRRPYGEPVSHSKITANDTIIQILRYSYAEAAPYVEKVPARAMVYSFDEGKLVGFDYSSSFSGDKTDFDDSLVTKIKRGETTRAEVVQLLEKPTGEFIYPATLVNAPTQRAYSYARTDSRRAYPPRGGASARGTRPRGFLDRVRHDDTSQTRRDVPGGRRAPKCEPQAVYRIRVGPSHSGNV
jgi:hypothetical protein